MSVGNKTTGEWGSGIQYNSRIWAGDDDPEHVRWNAYSNTVQRYAADPTVLTRDSDGAYVGTYYVYGPTADLPDVIDSNLELKVLSKLTDDVRMHGFNAGIVLAELHQTTGLILTTLSGLKGIIQGAKAGNIAMVTRAFAAMTSGKKLGTVANSAVKARDISGTILATYYGWFPLISDIYEAMRLMSNRASEPRFMLFRHGINGPLEKRTFVNPGVYGLNDPANKVLWQGHGRLSYVVEFYEVLSLARSLGLYNPALVLWEKTPWSFVVDWFIPISSYLDNLGVLPSLDCRYMRSELRVANYHSWSGHAWYERGYTATGGSITGQNAKFTRTLGHQLQVPFPSLKKLGDVFSLAHIRNAAALIHQGIASARAHAH